MRCKLDYTPHKDRDNRMEDAPIATTAAALGPYPYESYGDILSRDSRQAPDSLKQGPIPDIGTKPVSTKRYFEPAFFRLEVEHVWRKIWQWACREEDIPNVGDCVLYEVVGRSLIIARTSPSQIKAFHNSCLHRGRKLLTTQGCKKELRCPYHGITWTLDGRFKENPIAWDFPQWSIDPPRLPEAQVATWGGFVFINFDRDAAPLSEIIAPLARDFVPYDFANRYAAVRVRKLIRANWKAVAEAFMESHHSITTHPQILYGMADLNSQYDVLSDYVTRQFSANAVSSPAVAGTYSEADIVRIMTQPRRADGIPNMEIPSAALPEGITARRFMADLQRKRLQAEDGHDYGAASDAEMLDPLLYNLWPHMSFWAGYMPNFVYRWRPNELDPETAIMDFLLLKPVPKGAPRPPPAAVSELGFDDSWSKVSSIPAALAAVFDQDMLNLPLVQSGLRASESGFVHFGRYTEMRIRLMHQMIDRYIAAG